MRYDAVMLIAFGGPESPDEVRPFLARVLKGIPIPSERVEEVVHHYQAVGGKSPLNEITRRQAQALQAVLQQSDVRLPVFVGMRNSRPFFSDALKQMSDAGVQRALGFILSAHQTEASWERYQRNIDDARAELAEHAPAVEYCAGWHDHPFFIQSWAERIEESFAQVRAARRETPLVFTAHSIPAPMASGSPYVAQVESTASLIAAKLGHDRWTLAYQSRSGKPTDPWLEPDINAVIRRLAAEHVADVVVAPIGFVCDHVEVLYDLDIETRNLATNLGMGFVRTSCPNDHPTFIRMMADVISASAIVRAVP